MKFHYLLPATALALAVTSTSCIDDKYDFSDIDTTARINVNDLTLPINIDAIQLKSIIDINEDDPNANIKIVDGAYAYVQSGDFSTSNISVPAVTVKAVNNSSIDFNLPINLPSIPSLEGIKLPDIPVDVPAQYTGYDFVARDISDDICGLYKVNGEFEIGIKVTLKGLEDLIDSYAFSDFGLLLPAGLEVASAEGATYSSSTNTLTINQSTTTQSMMVKCKGSGINIPAGAFDASAHTFTLSGEVGIIGGRITVSPKSNADVSKFNSLNLKVEYTFSPIEVKSVDGEIKYQISGVDIPEIQINDLPDVLAQPGTNLLLANPCLYLGVSNPLHAVGAYAQTGFEITAYHGAEGTTYAIDNPYFTINPDEIDNFCFSPKRPTAPDAEYAGCVHVPFAGLSRVLSGDGLPDKLKVDLVNPQMPRQRITDFMLGHDYGNVHGTYKFVAPLQFETGTQVVYSDLVDGWSSDDLDKMTITRLDVTLNITTDVPVSIDFTGYPVGKDGKRIGNVEITGAKIDANAKDQQVKISVNGTITGLDGIEFVAKASAVSSDKALSPDMQISLKNIRPCVSGYYQDEL